MDGTVVKAKVAKGRVDQSRKVVSATFHVKYRLAGPCQETNLLRKTKTIQSKRSGFCIYLHITLNCNTTFHFEQIGDFLMSYCTKAKYLSHFNVPSWPCPLL